MGTWGVSLSRGLDRTFQECELVPGRHVCADSRKKGIQASWGGILEEAPPELGPRAGGRLRCCGQKEEPAPQCGQWTRGRECAGCGHRWRWQPWREALGAGVVRFKALSDSLICSPGICVLQPASACGLLLFLFPVHSSIIHLWVWSIGGVWQEFTSWTNSFLPSCLCYHPGGSLSAKIRSSPSGSSRGRGHASHIRLGAGVPSVPSGSPEGGGVPPLLE